jgi:hypothetical protein
MTGWRSGPAQIPTDGISGERMTAAPHCGHRAVVGCMLSFAFVGIGSSCIKTP